MSPDYHFSPYYGTDVYPKKISYKIQNIFAAFPKSNILLKQTIYQTKDKLKDAKNNKQTNKQTKS